MHIYYKPQTNLTELIEIIGIVPDAECRQFTDGIDEEIYLCFDENGLNICTDKFNIVNLLKFYRQFIDKRKHMLKNENLIQAINLSKFRSLSFIHALDLTGGLGRDSILLALSGVYVTIIEENPYLAIILNYLRLNFNLELLNFHVIYGNSNDYLLLNEKKFQIVYFDPMFDDNKNALSKKDMQLIDLFIKKHNGKLLTNDDCSDLIYHYVKPICNKLVVKRDNKQAYFINKPLPTYQKQGKTVRFDVYQCDLVV